LIFIFLFLKVQANSIWVSKNTGSGNGPGTIDSPFDDVQAGIDAAVDGDTVWVLPASYSFRYGIDFSGKKIVLKSAYGPFASILRGSFLPHLRFNSGEDTNTVIDGFSVGPEYADLTGSATLILVDSASPVLKNLIVNGSSLTAGFYQAYPSLVYVLGQGSAPVIDNCLFTNNTVGVGYGARIIRMGGDVRPLINKCTFADNRKTKYSTSTSFSSIFVDVYGMNNSIVYGNTLPGSLSNPRYISVATAGGSVTYSDIEAVFSGTGNIKSDPSFYSGDYRLMPGSPCINTGDPASPLDPDGSRIDMGFSYDPDWIPHLRFVYARDSTEQAPGIDGDDYVYLMFTGAASFQWPVITSDNIDSIFPLNNGHTWLSGNGEIKDVQWNTNALFIQLDTTGGNPTIAVSDTVDLFGLGIKSYVRGTFGLIDRIENQRTVAGGSRLNIKFNARSLGMVLPFSGRLLIALIDIRGRQVCQTAVFTEKTKDGFVDFRDTRLPAGLYLIEVRHDTRAVFKKVVLL
jgi:hypothetical protein